MGIFLCCVCDFFFNPKDRNFLILHYSFSFSKLFNHFTDFFKGIFTEVFHQDFFCFSLFVSFIHAAFRIWKNNSFTTELSEAFKYRAVTVDKRIFFYLNLPYCSIFTLFLFVIEKMEKASLFSCHHRIYFLFDNGLCFIFLFFLPIFEKVRLI